MQTIFDIRLIVSKVLPLYLKLIDMPDPTLPPNDPKHPKPGGRSVKENESVNVPEIPEQEEEE